MLSENTLAGAARDVSPGDSKAHGVTAGTEEESSSLVLVISLW